MMKAHQELHAALLILEADGLLARFVTFCKERGVNLSKKRLEKLYSEDYKASRLSEADAATMLGCAVALVERFKGIKDERALLFPECQQLILTHRQNESWPAFAERLQAKERQLLKSTVSSVRLSYISRGRYTQSKQEGGRFKYHWIISLEQALLLKSALTQLEIAAQTEPETQSKHHIPRVYGDVTLVLKRHYPIKLDTIARSLALYGVDIHPNTISALRCGRSLHANGHRVISEAKAKAVLEALILGLAHQRRAA